MTTLRPLICLGTHGVRCPQNRDPTNVIELDMVNSHADVYDEEVSS